MRRATFLMTTALAIVPHAVPAQVSVTSPVAGTASSYRNTVISWDPIAGASSYHLEVDDDPGFGSPEVDVIVGRTSYAMSGELLNLHGQLSWAAYVRLNGLRWNAGTFTPSYFKEMSSPALSVDSWNRVYLGFTRGWPGPLHLVTSSDWSSIRRLSPQATSFAYTPDVAVDENDVAHAFWYEQGQVGNQPYYANSSTGWDLVPLAGPIVSSCAEPSMVAKGGRIDLFYAGCQTVIDRWTSADGADFTHTAIPNNDVPISVSAARDGVGNLYIASERYTARFDDLHSALQTSADGWIARRFAPGRFPTLSVTPTGELHALRWGYYEYDPARGLPFLYSNSLRGFETWTELPVRSSYFHQDILPLVLDPTRGQLHTAVPSDDGIQLCSAASTGLAADTGATWTCQRVGYGSVSEPDLAVAQDGTLHVAWGAALGVGYANSLGSFLAANLTPQVSFGTPAGTPSSAIVPTAVSDPDGDDVSGDVRVGRYEPVASLVPPGGSVWIVDGTRRLSNAANETLYNYAELPVFFRVAGSDTWSFTISRASLPPLPVMVEVGQFGPKIWGVFAILAWDDTGATISQIKFVSHLALTYSGAIPHRLDISAMPDGDLMLAVSAWDGFTSAWQAQAFSKSSGQRQLLLTPPGEETERPSTSVAITP